MAEDKKSVVYRLKLYTKDFEKKLKSAASRFKRFAEKMKTGAKTIFKNMYHVEASINVVMMSIRKLLNAVRGFAKMETAFLNIATLLDGPLLEATKRQIVEQSKLYGGDIQANAKAYYDIVSAGFSDQQQALQILDQSNKMAIAGVTDVATAADGLTSVMNAYAEQMVTAQEVSDFFFLTVKAGKTTISELAYNIGQVAPIASKANVELKELGAMIAEITKQGNKTPETMTQIKALLSSVIKKEGKEAVVLLEQYGVQWDSATIKQKGFTQALIDLIEAFDGNIDKLNLVIPSIRAFMGLLGLAADDGHLLKAALEDMNNSVDATQEAFNKVSDSVELKINKQLQTLKATFRELSGELVPLTITMLKFGNTMASAVSRGLNNWKKFRFFLGALIRGKDAKAEMADKLFKFDVAQPDFSAFAQTKEKKQTSEEKKLLKEARARKKISDITASGNEKLLAITQKTVKAIRTGIQRINADSIRAIDSITQKAMDMTRKIGQALFGGQSTKQGMQLQEWLSGNVGSAGRTPAGRIYGNLRGQTSVNTRGVQGSIALTKAAEIMAGFDQQDANAVQQFIDRLKEYGQALSGQDILGFAQAVAGGRNPNDLAAQERMRDFEEQKMKIEKEMLEKRQAVEKQTQEKIKMMTEQISEVMLKAQKEVVDKMKKNQDEFNGSVIKFKETSTLFKEASEKIEKASNQPVVLKLKGDLGKIISQELSKLQQNRTGELSVR